MHTSAHKGEEASPRTPVIDYILQKFNPYLLSLSFPKLSRAHSQHFSAYSHYNTNIHYFAYTFLLHKHPTTPQNGFFLLLIKNPKKFKPWFVTPDE